MKKLKVLRLFSVLVFAGLFAGAGVCSAGSGGADATTQANVVEKQDTNVFEGKIVGVSKKAKSFSIVVGKGDKEKVELVKFDDNTVGMDFANKDEAAIVHFETRGADKFAKVVEPKLAKLPDGVSEIQPEEMIGLVALGLEKGECFLVDSRPAQPFAAGHVPYSVSIPVDLMEAKGAELLPADKDMPLIFYCGGPT